jgi:hypothetical protein
MTFDKIRVIRFNDGITIVACVQNDYDLSEDFINIMYPIEVYSGGIDEYDESLSESYMLKSWMGLSDDVAFTVSTSSIMVVSKLIESHKEGYEQCVKKIFFEERLQRKHAATDELLSETLSPDDLLKYMEARNKNKLN